MEMFEFYKQAKKRTWQLLSRSHDWLTKVNRICNIGDTEATLLENKRRIIEDEFHLVVVGEFSSGKSYFINVLLDKIQAKEVKGGKFKVTGLLPTRLSPTTSTITILRYGVPERAIVTYKDGNSVEIPLDAVEKYLAEAVHSEKYEGGGNWLGTLFGKNKKAENTRVLKVDIFCDSPWLHNGVCIVDTPGMGSIIREHSAITTSYIPKADAVIFMFPVQPPMNNYAKLFLSQCAFHVDRFFFVETMKDSEYFIDANNTWQSVIENGKPTIEVATTQNAAILSAALEKQLEKQPNIFLVSSRWAANEKLDLHGPGIGMSGFSELTASIEEFLVQNRGYVALERRITEAQNIVNRFDAELAAMEAQIGTSVSEIEGKLREQEPVVKAILEDAESLSELVKDEFNDTIRAVCRSANEAAAFLNNEITIRVLNLNIPRMKKEELRTLDARIAYIIQQGMNVWIAKESLNSVRPAFRKLRNKIKHKGRILEESARELRELAGISCAISEAVSRLSSLDITQVVLPDINSISVRMQTSVSCSIGQSEGFWNTITTILGSAWNWLTGNQSGQWQALQNEIEQMLNAEISRLSIDLVASYAAFLKQESSAIKKQIALATNTVIQQYNGSLKKLRDDLLKAQSETEKKLQEIQSIRQEGATLSAECKDILVHLSPEAAAVVKQ